MESKKVPVLYQQNIYLTTRKSSNTVTMSKYHHVHPGWTGWSSIDRSSGGASEAKLPLPDEVLALFSGAGTGV